MSYLNINCCSKLAMENEEIKKKYRKLKQQKEELEKRLLVFLEERKGQPLLKNPATTRNVHIQTDKIKPSISTSKTKPSKINIEETEQVNKLISMQSQIMKRYEKEVKQNMDHLENISQLNGKIVQLETKNQKSEEEIFKLKTELFKIKGTAKVIGGGKSIKQIVDEKNKLKKENKKLRTELEGFDKAFFDEVEDIKYALQQSAKLNKEYEKILTKMCNKFGVPFPNPEKVLSS